MDKFINLGVIKNASSNDNSKTNYFSEKINVMKQNRKWQKHEIIDLFNYMLPQFNHIETGKFLDSKM